MENPVAEPWPAGVKALEADREVSDALFEVLDVFLSHEADTFTNNVVGVSQCGVDDTDISFNFILYREYNLTTE